MTHEEEREMLVRLKFIESRASVSAFTSMTTVAMIIGWLVYQFAGRSGLDSEASELTGVIAAFGVIWFIRHIMDRG